MQDKEKFFKALLKENSERLYRISCYYAKNYHDQEDLYQEIIINIWKSLSKFRGDSSINTWVYRIAINTSIDFVRKESRKKEIQEGFRTEMGSIMRSGVTKNTLLRMEKTLYEIHSLLNQLSVIDKVIMTLILEDLPGREIASIVGITESNVRIKVHRIKQFLKLNIKGGYINE